jgi:hypothetical protein
MGSFLPAVYAKGNPSINGTGTFSDTSVTILSIQMVGPNEVIKDAGTGVVTGTLTGTYSFTATITVQPTGVASYSAIDVCQCTGAGKEGGLVFTEDGTGNVITGVFQSQAVITKASGGFKEATGTSTLHGMQDPATSLTSGAYSITLSLDLK